MRYPIRALSLSAVLCLVFLAAGRPVAAQDGTSLYQRLGGYDAIAAFVGDFFGRFGADEELAPYMGGLNAKAQARVFQHFVDFMCSQAGGPCLYNGADMPAAHEGLGIPSDHFDLVMTHMTDALDATVANAVARRELLGLLHAMRGEIVSGG
ncbi:MAG: group 1 truncated hemoglobin [Gemmatimonadetes bacterium]|nr:group 1 truncated hemoglobin [Gemmatimonadota bacterium]